MPDDNNDECAVLSPEERERTRLREQLAQISAERDELQGVAESYRLAAKERAEMISELTRVSQAAPTAVQERERRRFRALERELRRLRALERRLAVRVIVNVLAPFERPYQVVKRRMKKNA